jgi:hypothetical protein
METNIYQERRQAAQFAHYALAASAEALEDAGYKDGKGLDCEMTVRIVILRVPGINRLNELGGMSWIWYWQSRGSLRHLAGLWTGCKSTNLRSHSLTNPPAEELSQDPPVVRASPPHQPWSCTHLAPIWTEGT